MFRVLGCVFEQHDLRLVLLAGVLCIFACVTAMSMLSRARHASGYLKRFWLGAAGTVAGCGIWGTHFVAMLAYEQGFPVAYDPGPTILSVIIAITLSSFGFWATLSRPGPVIGGALSGAAIGAMHYVGMAAVRAPAQAIWDPTYVVSSVLIGIVLMALGMRFAVTREDWRGYIVSGLVFTVAICSLHFTAMTAVVYKFDPRVVVPNAVLAPTELAVAVAAGAVLIIALGLVGAVVDNHLAQRASGEAARLRAHVAELEATQAALEQTSQRLATALASADAANTSKSRFLAAMSHELRTPLNAVIGFSEMMGAEAFGPLGHVRYKDYIRDIHASGTHLLALINDILDLTKLDTGETLNERAVDVDAVINDALHMIAPQAERAGIHVSADIARALPALQGDERRIKQILINLLSNAVKFSYAEGSVRVRAWQDDDGIAITIADDGIGIAPENIEKALERFGQVDSTLARKFEGAGLGLPLAKQLAEMHGGTLSLESELHKGTIVTVKLPGSRIIPTQQAVAA